MAVAEIQAARYARLQRLVRASSLVLGRIGYRRFTRLRSLAAVFVRSGLRHADFSTIGDVDGKFFALLSYHPAEGSVALAKKVQIDPTLADAQVPDFEKGKELRQPWVHDSEFSVGCIRL